MGERLGRLLGVGDERDGVGRRRVTGVVHHQDLGDGGRRGPGGGDGAGQRVGIGAAAVDEDRDGGLVAHVVLPLPFEETDHRPSSDTTPPNVSCGVPTSTSKRRTFWRKSYGWVMAWS